MSLYIIQYLVLATFITCNICTALRLQSDEWSNISHLVNHICKLENYITVNIRHTVIEILYLNESAIYVAYIYVWVETRRSCAENERRL